MLSIYTDWAVYINTCFIILGGYPGSHLEGLLVCWVGLDSPIPPLLQQYAATPSRRTPAETHCSTDTPLYCPHEDVVLSLAHWEKKCSAKTTWTIEIRNGYSAEWWRLQLRCLIATWECLGSKPGSTAHSSFLLLQILGDSSDSSTDWGLPPCREIQVGFPTPGFFLSQKSLWTFAERTCLCLSTSQIKIFGIEVFSHLLCLSTPPSTLGI